MRARELPGNFPNIWRRIWNLVFIILKWKNNQDFPTKLSYPGDRDQASLWLCWASLTLDQTSGLMGPRWKRLDFLLILGNMFGSESWGDRNTVQGWGAAGCRKVQGQIVLENQMWFFKHVWGHLIFLPPREDLQRPTSEYLQVLPGCRQSQEEAAEGASHKGWVVDVWVSIYVPLKCTLVIFE